MLRAILMSGGVALATVAFLRAAPASAQLATELGPQVTIYVSCNWFEGGERLVTQIEEVKWRPTMLVLEDGKRRIQTDFGSYVGALERSFEKRVGKSTDCEWEESPIYRYSKPGTTYESVVGRMIAVRLKEVDPEWFMVEHLARNTTVVSLDRQKTSTTASKSAMGAAAESDPEKNAGSESGSPPPAEERAARAAEREAEFQKKQAEYEAALAEQQKQVAEFEQAKAAVARKKEEQRLEAERAKADYEAKQEEHRREVERLAQQGFAEQARYALCLGGDQKACADMQAGVPVNVEVAEAKAPDAKAPQASTDDDARTCVSRPVVSGTGTKGQMQAVVFNGCLKPVDVRICLLRSGGWNCGVEWGLKPQAKWAHTSFETQGEIFWDARISGVERPLQMPN